MSIQSANNELEDFLSSASKLAREAGLPDDEAVAHEPMILVVEDDEAISKTIQIRLGMHGYRVCQAYDAVLAMDVAKRNCPDLVILDVSMPGGNGFDVAERLHQEPETAEVPIIFLTASMRPDLPDKAARAGASAFMTKPYNADELLSEVRRLTSGGYELD